MKGKRTSAVARIVIDTLMALAFVLVMATALVAEAPHEFLGLALFVLVIAHVVVNRRWFTTLARGRWNVARALKLIAIIGLVACLIGQLASALVLSEHAFAFLPAIPGAAWARRVHMICSYWSFVFAFAHAGLQVKDALTRIGAGRAAKPAAVWAIRVVVVAIAAFGAISFVQLNLPAYLTGQVQFAAGEPNVPLACARWASVGILVAATFHVVRRLMDAASRKGGA